MGIRATRFAELVSEAVDDIRQCLRQGAHTVQIDFTEGRRSLKLDPSGALLEQFIALNNRVLDHFNEDERQRIGIHTCPGGDRDSTHSADVNYAGLLPALFQLRAGRFYVQLASERDPERVLRLIAQHRRPDSIVFVGVIDPIKPAVETVDQVRDRILLAARHTLSRRWARPTTAASRRSPTTPRYGMSHFRRFVRGWRERLVRRRNWARKRLAF